MPARILATFSAGWKSSPSAKAQPSRSASSAATVDLPEPETPMTTTEVMGVALLASMIGTDTRVRLPDTFPEGSISLPPARE